MLNKVALSKASKILEKSNKEFKVLFETGGLSVELYKPNQIDRQQPHERDEIYVIARGEGKFYLEEEITQVSMGDFLFVPAGATHRFTDFSEDFSTWVFFYGQNGGEGGRIKNYSL